MDTTVRKDIQWVLILLGTADTSSVPSPSFVHTLAFAVSRTLSWSPSRSVLLQLCHKWSGPFDLLQGLQRMETKRHEEIHMSGIVYPTPLASGSHPGCSQLHCEMWLGKLSQWKSITACSVLCKFCCDCTAFVTHLDLLEAYPGILCLNRAHPEAVIMGNP